MSKRKIFIGLALLLVLMMVLAVGCGKENAAENTPEEPAATPEEPVIEETGPAEKEPVWGGTLRIITGAGPAVLSYYPEMGPAESGSVLGAAEMLLVVSEDRTHEPQLAEWFEEDPEARTITFKLREGIKFHDGTDLTADVVKWNYESYIQKLMFNDLLKEIEVVDDYTLVFHVHEWHNQLLPNWGYTPIFSREAYEKNGGAEWARTNIVGTGPFMLEEWKRDVHMIWVKNPNYWREGPYLDRIEITYIPEATTAAAKMEAGEADIWLSAPPQYVRELEDKGFVRQSGWAGAYYHLMPNTMDPNSPFNDLRVREALEYAIDKQAICDALGYGYTSPLHAVAAEGEWGGRSEPVRPYNPEKARELLAEAGYADGLKVTLLASVSDGGRNDTAEALANYLNDAGFIVELDIADAGRFLQDVFVNGWKDLVIMYSGTDMNYLVSAHRWFGPQPMTNLASFRRPPELVELFNESLKAFTLEEQKAATEKIVDYMTEQALIIPLFQSPGAFLHNGKVHTSYMKHGFTRWDHHDMWLEQ
ncbi:MAG: ABC transporter substrate-binding protein [Firmicutes bacterium]|nr:ABC transporter substrate-binding protein [Bacillota bacterium]